MTRIGDPEDLSRGRRRRARRSRRSRRRAVAVTWTIDGSPALAEGTYTAQASQTDTAGEHRHQRREHVRGRHDRAGGGDHRPGRRLADQRRDARHHRHRRHRRRRRGHGHGQALRRVKCLRLAAPDRSPRPWAVAAAGRSRPPRCRRAPTRCRRPRPTRPGTPARARPRRSWSTPRAPAVTLTAPADGVAHERHDADLLRCGGQRGRRQRVGDRKIYTGTGDRRHARCRRARRPAAAAPGRSTARRRWPTGTYTARRRRPTTPATPARALRARSRSTPRHPPSR